MTLREISIKHDLPMSTLKDWRNPLHKKHKLFLFLQNSDDLQKDTRYVRLLQVLNRNIAKEYRFTPDELYRCFKKRNYARVTQRERIILSRLFKEGDIEDVFEIERVLHVDQNNIRSLFESSPFCYDRGFQSWRNAYQITCQNEKNTKEALQPKPIKNYLVDFLQQRNIHV